jgi:cholesterol transport system auxiliary component
MRKALLAPLLLILPLAGCINLGLGTSKSPPSMLTLTAQSAPADGTTSTGRADAALSVLEPQTEAKLAVLRVPVNIDASRVAYLKQALWVERPSRLFQHLLAETLRARGNRLVTEGDTVTHGPILSGRLLDFGYDVPRHAVVVRFDAIRTNPDGTTETRRFEAGVDNIDADVGQVGPALNQAANQVAKAVADWVG